MDSGKKNSSGCFVLFKTWCCRTCLLFLVKGPEYLETRNVQLSGRTIVLVIRLLLVCFLYLRNMKVNNHTSHQKRIHT